jgi:hypothetical protein
VPDVSTHGEHAVQSMCVALAIVCLVMFGGHSAAPDVAKQSSNPGGALHALQPASGHVRPAVLVGAAAFTKVAHVAGNVAMFAWVVVWVVTALQPPSAANGIDPKFEHVSPAWYASVCGRHMACGVSSHAHAHAPLGTAGSTTMSEDVPGHDDARSFAKRIGWNPSGAPHAPASHVGLPSDASAAIASEPPSPT